MSKVFADYKFKWEGVEHSVPSDRIMGAIARVEEHVTMGELYEMLADYRKVKNQTLASAYAALLQYAGQSVTRDTIYEMIFPSDSETQAQAMAAITGLLELMIPQSVKDKALKAQQKAGQALSQLDVPKNENRRARRAAASSSKRRTKRLDNGASALTSSGSSTQ